MSSYAISQTFDVRDVLSAGLWSLWTWLRTLLLLLVLGCALAAVFAVVVACWLPIVQGIGGLTIIAAFGWATFPRCRAVK